MFEKKEEIMNFVLVAGDYAQSHVLEILNRALVVKGHDVQAFLGYGKQNVLEISEIAKSIRNADRLVVCMSEMNTEEAAAAQLAHKYNIHVTLFCDTFGTYKLPAFENMRGCKSDELAIFMSCNEVNEARELFPKAKITVTGNPRWEKLFNQTATRAEICQRFGLDTTKRTIMSIGGKSLCQNIMQFGTTIDAIHKLGWDTETETLLAIHPSDTNEHVYTEIIQKAGCSTRLVGQCVGIDPSHLIDICKIVINFTSTLGIQAAYRGIPVIDFCSTISLEGKKPIIGVSPWILVQKSASMPVYFGSVDQLCEHMHSIEYSETCRTAIRLAQADLCRSALTITENNGPISVMLDLLES